MSRFLNLLRRIWDYIKHIALKVVNFFKNIVNYFKSKESILKNNPDVIAVSIKENLRNRNYNKVNCLYDKEEDNILGYNYAQGIEAEELDAKTRNAFGNKDMIILQ